MSPRSQHTPYPGLAGWGLIVLLLAGGSSGQLPSPRAPAPVRETRTHPVILVRATSSAPHDAERNYAEKLTARLAGWLQECGIPTATLTDDQLSPAVLSKAKVVMLPCNASPGTTELLSLRRFTEGGGKLIVFYSASPGLADLMGMKLGAFPPTAGAVPWSGFRFVEGVPQGTPARIEQESRNIRPVYPRENQTRVIAWWDPLPGKRERDPAWIQSEKGFWMTHILLESDVAAKKQLLVSLLGFCDASLWQAAATHAASRAGTLGLYASSSQAIASIRNHALQRPSDRTVETLLSQAERLQQELLLRDRAGRYPGVLDSARQLDLVLLEATARMQSPQPGEFRGAWNHSGTGFAAGQWEETCRILARNGMTAVLPNVQRPWCAHYPSSLIPASDTLTRYGDQLGGCLAAARRHGLETHAWIILWSLDGAPESVVAAYRRTGRLQVSATGSPVTWLCPSHPDNRAFELAAIRDLATRYPELDGVQLDYIRYKSLDTCYCEGCRTRFIAETGRRVQRWPADVRSGTQTAAYRQWRRDQITRLVGEVRRELRQINPRLKLSASVYAGYPGCADSIAQDWGAWLRDGLLDFVCPMNYSADPVTFREWYRKQVSFPGVRGKLFAGIGVTSLECRLNAAQTINQINILRTEGATGFTLFEANPTLKTDILPYLGMGITAK